MSGLNGGSIKVPQLGVGSGGGGGEKGGGGGGGQGGSGGGGVGGQGASAAGSSAVGSAAARKRRSSINVYDQPSSLNSRLRQLETDMLRLDEDRTKLYDDTHSALANFELRVSEIHAILKSRQDNVEKYVDDMWKLLAAKDEFERQTKSLAEKHDRIYDKFMHRETIVSREIKLLKNKFELLEKSRQFKSLLQKSNLADQSSASAGDELSGNGGGGGATDEPNNSDDNNKGAPANAKDSLASGKSGGADLLLRPSAGLLGGASKLLLSPLKQLLAGVRGVFGAKVARQTRAKRSSKVAAMATTSATSASSDGGGGGLGVAEEPVAAN